MNEDLELIKKEIVPILKTYNVTKAGIFGSYARGEQKRNSDVDILIEIGDEIGLTGFIGVQIELEKKLKKKVDLVEYSCIRKELKRRILNDEIPLKL